ncbi:efflux RND transporter periplasmic adaptor subunit [Pseudoalteromonas rubra]|uniref:Efflux RND transporter periplasmic adaptor subunit n=1 Tax=Pseudoalteromonas rubra TaxID=43658 RepID=A0A5S3WIW9_9GAMM|nr:efflux RND transporter periplasmic adaptor subunit [Pseudoalteromonas rubra]TMP26565.1 efflux RND transporter periplasmic adaptor subunit [Pseudoalteromonas rubra]TMP32815.1 efflux RND transporter periplasmic adaptor subunit [Pseudoalteromonas rubra]
MNIKPWISTASVVATLMVGSIALKGRMIEARNTEFSEQATTVEAMRVETVPYQSYIDISGVIKAPQTINLVNEVAGKITRLHFKSGDLVKAGEPLVEIDHAEELAQLAAARARVTQQESILVRYRNLHERKKFSDQQLEEAITQLAEFRAQVDLLTARIDKKVIKAPFTAYVGIHDLQVGQYLAPNTVLTNMVGLQAHMWVDFSVPQTYQALAINTPIRVSLVGDNAEPQVAYVESVEPGLSTASRQLKYRARIERTEQLNTNQLVKISLPIGTNQEVIAVPYLAIVKDQLGDYVYLLEEDEQGTLRATRQQVELGERLGDMVMITGGLEEDRLIASSGAFKLRNGLKTFVSEPQQPEQSVAMEDTQKEGVSL